MTNSKKKTIPRWAVAALATAGLALAAVTGVFLFDESDRAPVNEAPTETEIQTLNGERSAELLARLRDHQGAQWPPQRSVAPVTAASLPADLTALTVDERKELFFRVLTPIILAENQRIRMARAFVVELPDDPDTLSTAEQQRLQELAAHYRVELDAPEFERRLLRRIDLIPASLAMAQAANESGWGTSRFTREANNLFGEWTWTQEEGLIPQQRAEGKTHRIRVFPSLQRSVRSYFYTLNVGHAYTAFRDEREQMRRNGNAVDGYALAQGLTAYSERGEAYVKEIRSMMQFNRLAALESLVLADEDLELLQ